MKRIFSIAAVLLVCLACEDAKDCCLSVDEDPSTVEGSWLLYEKGYSPGSGYITEDVGPKPAQIITLGSTKTFSSNIDGLKDYKFYIVTDDPHAGGKILALLKKDPDVAPPDMSNLEHSYNIELSGEALKLSFRFCFEGCHLGFKKIE